MDFDKYCIDRPKHVRLADWKTDDKGKLTKEKAEALMAELQGKLLDLQERLYAENQRSLLVILQARDAGGKDGTIKHVMSGLNPLGVSVVPFKVPNELEAAHDFLWRVHAVAPRKGQVTIFNRSHYEDILVPTVHGLADKEVIDKRYRHVRHFEELLADSGTRILKFYLHISKEEQRQRLQERLDDPEKHWKFNPGDLKERALWDEYTTVYERILSETSSSFAPWYVIPADRKWYRNYLIASVLVQTLESMDLKYPRIAEGIEHITIE
ncbi:polyphosphate kinase 2 family protein [Deinococcus cellulosilyticus]|uniref:Polyphosphate kinase n=1 Tax=Deinococcus cellulosilyticus (strain DSM 18568 / NBRC 106333 / KACC 11606 / 5516J-15) TaxID=1223518 RepID=A0A511N7R7_DEIC1|nr:polyphosphate kinase 2 family protein [Deinococcus cellulosilyticus]GEM48528.1 polyphosphate kinase [Deinococcus cellulosilyticus NBRC 106333 = KACC 11606]